jgi:hypothetical protein
MAAAALPVGGGTSRFFFALSYVSGGPAIHETGMLYVESEGLIRPFYQDEEKYICRYFCETQKEPKIPAEHSIPKSSPEHVCPHCCALFRVGHDQDGPYLEFLAGQHFAADELF